MMSQMGELKQKRTLRMVAPSQYHAIYTPTKSCASNTKLHHEENAIKDVAMLRIHVSKKYGLVRVFSFKTNTFFKIPIALHTALSNAPLIM